MKTNGTTMVPLVFSPCSKRSIAPDQIMGKIVVCVGSDGDDDDGHGDEDIGVYLQHAGAAGLVFVDPDESCYTGIRLPALVISYTTALKLGAYMKSVQNPMASFSFSCEAVIGENRAPMVAGFSSRGPNPVVPDLLKPDVIAPGANILATWTGNGSPSNC